MCDRFGRPRWWRHYVYGLAWLGREHLRQQLTLGQAMRLAQSSGKDAFIEWQRDALYLIQPQSED